MNAEEQRRSVASAPANAALTGRGPGGGGLDATVSGHLVDAAHTIAPYGLGAMLARELRARGAWDISIWLQDYAQRSLHPVAIAGEAPAAEESMDGSLAGRAFTLQTIVEQVVADGTRLWLPLIDGTERLGVMALTVAAVDENMRGHLRRMAGTVAQLLFSKDHYTDDYARLRRSRDLTLAAEMQWNLLPPLTITTPEVSVAGMLEPAHKVAGDSFDYALNADGLHFAIFDAMGHGIRSAILASTVIAAYRHARRSDTALGETYAHLDGVISQQFGGDSFTTAILATLDVDSGTLCWVNAGHPPPLLVRGHKVIDLRGDDLTVPIGLAGAPPPVNSEQLEPGDLLLLFTDGVVEQRDSEGEMFGEQWLVERLLRHVAEHLPTAEVLRRLNRDVVDIAGEEGLRDDASLLLVQWGGGPELS